MGFSNAAFRMRKAVLCGLLTITIQLQASDTNYVSAYRTASELAVRFTDPSSYSERRALYPAVIGAFSNACHLATNSLPLPEQGGALAESKASLGSFLAWNGFTEADQALGREAILATQGLCMTNAQVLCKQAVVLKFIAASQKKAGNLTETQKTLQKADRLLSESKRLDPEFAFAWYWSAITLWQRSQSNAGTSEMAVFLEKTRDPESLQAYTEVLGYKTLNQVTGMRNAYVKKLGFE